MCLAALGLRHSLVAEDLVVWPRRVSKHPGAIACNGHPGCFGRRPRTQQALDHDELCRGAEAWFDRRISRSQPA